LHQPDVKNPTGRLVSLLVLLVEAPVYRNPFLMFVLGGVWRQGLALRIDPAYFHPIGVGPHAQQNQRSIAAALESIISPFGQHDSLVSFEHSDLALFANEPCRAVQDNKGMGLVKMSMKGIFSALRIALDPDRHVIGAG